MINPKERYEMELAVYRDALANYQNAVSNNPAIRLFLHEPVAPTLIQTGQYWTMRKIVTSSRRKWK